MVRYYIDKPVLVAIADAIREKTGVEEEMTPREMPEKIRGIVSAADPIIVLTQSEYDALVAAGEVNPDIAYCIIKEGAIVEWPTLISAEAQLV